MKKALLSFGLFAVVAGASLSFSSCNKIKDEIKSHMDPIDWTQPSYSFTVPVVTSGNVAEYDSVIINIDQIIHDNAGVDFSIDDISEINLKKVTIHLANTDASNNWTNFESATAWIATDKGNAANKESIVASYNISDVASEQYTDKVLTATTPINMKDYFNGGDTKVYYIVGATSRRATTHEMTATVTVDYEMKP